MVRWAPTSYIPLGLSKELSEIELQSALRDANRLIDAGLPPILTLGHLAFHTDVDYPYLRKLVSRKHFPYRTFKIRKRNGGYRNICVPEQQLLRVQKWIDRYILSKFAPSSFSYAFSPGNTIFDCAKQHSKATFLIKIDMRHFFESISEIKVYNCFNSLGYGNLVSFELARLCTKISVGKPSSKYKQSYWLNRKNRQHLSLGSIIKDKPAGISYKITDYNFAYIGYLPQGAPTSPKLANLVCRDMDNEIGKLADKQNLTYTRYADDMVFSSYNSSFNKTDAIDFLSTIKSIILKNGFRLNPQKTSLTPPGGRKIVLGLCVETGKPMLTKIFKKKLECHLYYCSKDPQTHANRRGFNSVFGLKNHINGLLSYARQIDSEYIKCLLNKYGAIDWPI